MNKNYCPVCGFILLNPPWEGDSPSDEICPSCGIQFGYDDIIKKMGDGLRAEKLYSRLREKWISNGMKWWSDNPLSPKPDNWDPKTQLAAAGLDEVNKLT